MANKKISQLPEYTGNTAGTWLVMNNSGQTTTYKVLLSNVLASGTSGTSGTSGSSGINGTNGTSGTSGSSGTSGTAGSSGTSGIVPSGTIKMFQIDVFTLSGSLSSITAVTGPNGENKTTLESQGWSFSNSASTVSATRPIGLRLQPLTNFSTIAGSVDGYGYIKYPTAVNSSLNYSVIQNKSGSYWSDFTFQGLTYSNAGYNSNSVGTGSCIVLFGLLS